jgi:hypothetical protein
LTSKLKKGVFETPSVMQLREWATIIKIQHSWDYVRIRPGD